MPIEPSLHGLLRDILDDFQRLLKTAKNGPAKRRLASRIARIERAIAALPLVQGEPRLPPKRIEIARV